MAKCAKSVSYICQMFANCLRKWVHVLEKCLPKALAIMFNKD